MIAVDGKNDFSSSLESRNQVRGKRRKYDLSMLVECRFLPAEMVSAFKT